MSKSLYLQRSIGVLLCVLFVVAEAFAGTAPPRARPTFDMRDKRVLIVSLIGNEAVGGLSRGVFSTSKYERVDPGFDTVDRQVESATLETLKSIGVNAQVLDFAYVDAEVYVQRDQATLLSYPGFARDDVVEAIAARVLAEHGADAAVVLTRIGAGITSRDEFPIPGYGVLQSRSASVIFFGMRSQLFVPGRTSKFVERFASTVRRDESLHATEGQLLPTPQVWQAVRPMLEDQAARVARTLAIDVYARALLGRPFPRAWRDQRFPREPDVAT